MKRYYKNLLKIYTIAVICCLQIFAMANSNCATQLTSNQASYILETQDQRDAINVDEVINDTIDIPVVAHILKSDSNTLTISTEEIDTAIMNLNNGFSQTGLQFNLCATNEIPYSIAFDTIYYSIYNTSNEFSMASETLKPRALNIYFVPEAKAPNGERVCGWASFPAEYYKTGKNWIVIRDDCANNGSTLIHEVGHFFNLYHTHQGKNSNLGITAAEFANASNCGPSVGDGVCDTPAEPYMAGRGIQAIVNEDCDVLCEYIDANEDVYSMGYAVGDEVRYNYMSYAPFKCRDRFTEDQVERMKKSYLIDRNYLSNLCPGIASTVCDPLKDKKALYKLYSAIGGPISDNWDGVTFNSDGCVTAINLNNTDLSGEIPIEIDDLNYLTTLNLSNNNICGALPTSIGNLKQLQILNLSNNQISGEIPSEINGLSSLTNLDLSSNNLSGYVSYQISQIDILRELKLLNNDFNGCLHKDLIRFIELQNIEIDSFHLELDTCTYCNKDDWNAIKFIYENMGGRETWLADHERFKHHFDSIAPPVDCSLASISPNIQLNYYTGRVKYLNLSGLGLSGQLNDSLTLLKDLVELNLSHNSITGTIPKSFINLNKLQDLFLRENQLENCIPVALTKLCGQASISLGNYFFSSYESWGEACAGLGGYCEDEIADYVMPGDFNNDKKVTNLDLIYWRIVRTSSDTTGNVRENANIDWLPQYCQDWDNDTLGINKKHFDANGDGRICKADLNAFHQNYGKGTATANNDNADQTGGNGLTEVEGEISLFQESDGATGFYLTLKDATQNQNVQALVFTFDLGSFSYQSASFDYDVVGGGNKPIFENIKNIDGTNLIEVALTWDETKPPPVNNPFGRIFITAADNGSDGGESAFRIGNINILRNNVFTSAAALDIPFDSGNADDLNSVCSDVFLLNGNLSGDYTFNAASKIESPPTGYVAYVTGCTNMNFLSGGSIELNPGFRTQHGVTFKAEALKNGCEIPVPIPKLSQIELGLQPNPAANQTTLIFELEEASTVSVEVTDATGKPIMELLNNSNKAKGEHQITINTTQLLTGMYYCILKNKETISTQKLLVVN